MSIIGIWDTKQLEEWLEKTRGLDEEKIQKFHEDTIKEIAARALAKIIARTPVGEYGDKLVEFITKDNKKVSFTAKSNKVGGTLRRGWTGGNDIDPYSYILANTEVVKKGRIYTIIISNIVFYAPHVEFGHKTINGGFVDGQFMMTISMDEIEDELPALLEKKFNDFLGEYFNE
ncbi:HK97 gp10 family phage protein [Tissierella sp. MB52-C2]|uniref:HK97 gp10 family phage protein n=1 Tax=Tissierella sp. MB52-C2 TaxID=3070999 RepID=UPI00280B397C|nr:HK97 gp10 family phage protein [Tissierella sp. MB52-C2]WMM24050.1 HK97 gp10 family phage protein [Tissierella sp. MB52-C2]